MFASRDKVRGQRLTVRRRLRGVCASAFAVACLFGGFISPGAARADMSACKYTGDFCLWSEVNYQGDFFYAQYGSVPSSYNSLPSLIADESQSLWNNRNLYRTWIATENGGAGQKACINPEIYYDDLNIYQFPYANPLKAAKSIQSYQLTSNNNACDISDELR